MIFHSPLFAFNQMTVQHILNVGNQFGLLVREFLIATRSYDQCQANRKNDLRSKHQLILFNNEIKVSSIETARSKYKEYFFSTRSLYYKQKSLIESLSIKLFNYMKVPIEQPHSLNEQSDCQMQVEQCSSRSIEQEQDDLPTFPKQVNSVFMRKKHWVAGIIIFLLIGGVIISIRYSIKQLNLKKVDLQGQPQKNMALDNKNQTDFQSGLKQNVSKDLVQRNLTKQQQQFIELIHKQQPINQENLEQHMRKIDIIYKQQIIKLPVNPLNTYEGNEYIAHFLYKDEEIIKRRSQFIQQRINYIDSNQTLAALFLAKYNLYANEAMLKEGIAENEKDWLRLQNKFQLSSAKEELPMCIIVPSFNNNANFRIEANLNSIFTQNYSNYKAIIINDASTDKGNETYKEYFEFYRIDKSKYVYIQNTVRVTALQNIYEGTMNECGQDSVMMILDGDDQFIGRNVLKVFNWAFQSKKAGVVYSNFYLYQQQVKIKMGFTSQYTNNEKSNNLYRNSPMKFSQLRACRTQLFRKIKPQDLKNKKGAYFTMTYDQALFFPLMELSCGRVERIPGEIHYLYNAGTGNNDYFISRAKQNGFQQIIRRQKKYECLKQFNQTMSK